MILYIINHSYHYELENLIRVFYPNSKIDKVYEFIETKEDYVYTEISDKIIVRVCIRDFVSEKSADKDTQDDELTMVTLLYDILKEVTKNSPPWGLLTGIRPIKLFENVLKKSSFEEAKDTFKNKYFVSDEKLGLTIEVYDIEKEIKSFSKPNSFSLYISIPFCPSRCNYCSFISSSIEKTKHLIPEYVPLLCKEIYNTSLIAKELSLNLESVYIGGGTPTTLSSEDLKIIICEIYNDFDMSTSREFTVEAGRPDTITKDKLKTLLDSGVTRISINPQTMSDDVLKEIGRKHTVKQTIDAFNLAREVGFDNINMDVIAGLKTDNLDNFKNTIDSLVDLSPEAITVHTLALKSGSNLFMKGENLQDNYIDTIEDMVNYSYNKLKCNDYYPYYLYRQSKMLGNLENVGYSKKGYESFYNIYVMEETHSVLACGAGAVTKLRDPYSNYLERIFNFKYPFEYIDRFDEMLERKKQISLFYKKFL